MLISVAVSKFVDTFGGYGQEEMLIVFYKILLSIFKTKKKHFSLTLMQDILLDI